MSAFSSSASRWRGLKLLTPMVDQIELHPGMPQDETVEYCRARDILVEAWGPLAQGRLFESVELDVLAAKHRKSVSQIVLRWHLQRGILPLPKSITPSRIVENAQLFDFELSPQEMNFITHIKCESSGLDPDTFKCSVRTLRQPFRTQIVRSEI